MYVCMYHELYKLISPLSAWMFTPDKDKNRVLWHMLLYCEVFYREPEYFGVKDIVGGNKIGQGTTRGSRADRGESRVVPGTPEPRFCKIEQKSAYLQGS